MNIQKNFIHLLVTVSLMVAAGYSHAVAYCSLRDPVRTIYELFPEADNYRSNVQTVDRQARRAVQEQLSFVMHFNELGRHTLYVAQQGDKVLGFVHARSEMTTSGLSELVWAVSTDMKIMGVRVQRSRDLQLMRRDPVELGAGLVGKSLAQLNDALQQAAPGSLDALVTAGAMKVLTITQSVWPLEVLGDSAAQVLADTFGAEAQLEPIMYLYDAAVRQRLAALEFTGSSIFVEDQVLGFKVLDQGGTPMGMIFKPTLNFDEVDDSLVWVVDSAGTTRRVSTTSDAIDAMSLDATVGLAPESLEDCSNALELGALELAVVTRSHTAL